MYGINLQKRMNVNILPSLQHMANVIVASRLYNNSDIRKIAGMEELKLVQSKSQWGLLESKAMDKLAPYLPCSLRTSVAKVIRPLHEEVRQWNIDHEFILQYEPLLWFYKNIKNLYWKSDGTINKTLTAKKLVANEKNDLGVRFVMACTYFFEGDILALWEEVRKDWDYQIKETNQAVRFWRKWLKNGANEPWSEIVDTYFRVPHIKSSDIRLRISSFFTFLPLESKLKYFQFFEGHQVHNDDFRLCLLKMDEVVVTEMLHTRPFIALQFCFNWPFQRLFLKMAKELLSYLTVSSFKDFLFHMLTMYTRKGFDDFKLLEEFWNLSPGGFKDAVKQDDLFIRKTKWLLMEESQSPCLDKLVRKCFLD